MSPTIIRSDGGVGFENKATIFVRIRTTPTVCADGETDKDEGASITICAQLFTAATGTAAEAAAASSS